MGFLLGWAGAYAPERQIRGMVEITSWVSLYQAGMLLITARDQFSMPLSGNFTPSLVLMAFVRNFAIRVLYLFVLSVYLNFFSLQLGFNLDPCSTIADGLKSDPLSLLFRIKIHIISKLSSETLAKADIVAEDYPRSPSSCPVNDYWRSTLYALIRKLLWKQKRDINTSLLSGGLLLDFYSDPEKAKRDKITILEVVSSILKWLSLTLVVAGTELLLNFYETPGSKSA
ncbi:hypothetical protein E3N88_21781 [Mikania micrantha]|uniref:Uncharacterized protein n=1 Tax=Mikania micrantha TaxID=192012 RepID=A0A5N6NAD9_9ASTR|nr:hypothetical protein E3N88_21781 [Mikania micrantha]